MEIEFKKEYVPLILIVLIGIIYIYLASNTAMLGEDEAVYFTMAKEFLKVEYPTFTNTGFPNVFQPLVPLINVIPFYLFGVALSISKVVIAFFGVLTMIVIYLLGKKFGLIAGLLSVAILLSIPLFTQYMFINYLEVPIAFFSVLAIYLFLQLDSVKKAVLTGAVLALSFYAKGSGIFLILIFFIYSFIRYFYKRDIDLKLVFTVLLVSILMILPWIARNFMLYNYPYVEGLNLFFKQPPFGNPTWLSEALTSLSLNVNYYGTFGYISIIFGIFGSVYIILAKEKRLYVSILLIILFLLAFNFRGAAAIMDPRHLSIIFPEVAIIGAFFLDKFYEKDKKLLLLVVAILLLSVYSSITVALSTSSSQRYTQDYIQAMTWIKGNTPEDAKIFTAYTGSLSYFADRSNVWVIDEFPNVMTTQDPIYIYDTLKNYNVSYILIWRGIVADRYIIPESNLLGAFTYNFVNVVSNDKQHFNVTYQNQDNIIFKLV